MLAGTVYFYNEFGHVLLEMDIEDYHYTPRELFDKILELKATKVVVKGFSHNHQLEASESIIYSQGY